MTWTKLSDDFSDDCWTLSDRAFRLHVEAHIWSNRKLLDLRIPFDDLSRFTRHGEAVNELLQIGWWTQADTYYLIRHHAAYQRSREAVINQQAVNAANGSRGGRPRKPSREQATDLDQSPETESLSEPLSESETERDRTGQDRHLGRGVLKAHDENCKCPACCLASWPRPAA